MYTSVSIKVKKFFQKIDIKSFYDSSKQSENENLLESLAYISDLILKKVAALDCPNDTSDNYFIIDIVSISERIFFICLVILY